MGAFQSVDHPLSPGYGFTSAKILTKKSAARKQRSALSNVTLALQSLYICANRHHTPDTDQAIRIVYYKQIFFQKIKIKGIFEFRALV